MILNFYYGLVAGFLLGSFSSLFYFVTMYKLKRQFDERMVTIHNNVIDYLESKKEDKIERIKETN